MGMLSPRALLIPMVVIAATAHAVDRGQFENVPDDIRAWFKGVRSPAGIPCCDISDGASHGVRGARGSLLSSNQWFVVAGAGTGDHSKCRKPAWRSSGL